MVMAIGHAQVLAFFSQSAEFLGDVQVTAQHPSSGSHWLLWFEDNVQLVTNLCADSDSCPL
jgi:hypothetical protein